MTSSTRTLLLRVFLRCVAASVAGLAIGAAGAFTLSDGTTIECVARSASVPEVDVPAGTNAEFTGRAASGSSGYRIVWNRARLEALPPVMRDFLFFHECAHAQLATPEELAANCAGLKAMRAAGRGGVAVEAKIAAFYGAGNPYWAQTLACANMPDTPEPAATPTPAR